MSPPIATPSDWSGATPSCALGRARWPFLPRLANQRGNLSEATILPNPGRDCLLELELHFVAANNSISIDLKYSRSVAFRSQGNARRIEANIAKLPELLRKA